MDAINLLNDRMRQRFTDDRGVTECKIIQQNKHVYNQTENNLNINSMVFKLLCNSLARVLWHIPKKLNRGPGCIAINLDFSISKSNTNERFNLRKINFSSKRDTPGTTTRIENLIKYCFNETTNMFIDPIIKNYIKWILKEFDKDLPQDLGNKDLEDSIFLETLLTYLNGVNAQKINNARRECCENLYYVILIVFDFLVLQDIFKRHFVQHDQFYIEAFANDNGRIHPDSLLASTLSHFPIAISNKFIGTTFLCCIKCSIFLDCHSFEFIGTGKEFEIEWDMPPECKETSECYRNFTTDITTLSNQIVNEATQSVFRTTFRNHHPIHSCGKTSKKISNDISLYLILSNSFLINCC
jgi:hypothetical protein